MATTAVDNISNGIKNMGVNNAHENDSSTNSPVKDEWVEKWGFPLQEMYKISLRFFKEKEGTAFQLTYRQKLHLVALTKQAAFGKFRPDVSPDVGFLDVVGNDRKQAWQSLGKMTSEQAMADFVKQVSESCTLFEPYIEAHKAEREEAEKKRKEDTEKQLQETEESQRAELAEKILEAEKQKQLEQEQQIRNALNQQTQVQFRQYAEQQCPGNTQMQEDLIKQLQDQHFQQYMQQVYQQQLQQQQQQQTISQNTTVAPTTNGETTPTEGDNNSTSPAISLSDVTPVSPPTDEDEEYSLAAASMWTRKDIKEFKDSLTKDKESVIKIGSGETVTVRVPTHEDGTCLFWEFATDYYDIGFGVYFEWTQSHSNTISVHVSESSDEEDEEEEGKPEAEGKPGDVEKGSASSKKEENRVPTDEIIPVYRRDCHEEVYCGSHTYPGQGVYLLKFDNSYSLWRSKTLYYRVYYSR